MHLAIEGAAVIGFVVIVLSPLWLGARRRRARPPEVPQDSAFDKAGEALRRGAIEESWACLSRALPSGRLEASSSDRRRHGAEVLQLAATNAGQLRISEDRAAVLAAAARVLADGPRTPANGDRTAAEADRVLLEAAQRIVATRGRAALPRELREPVREALAELSPPDGPAPSRRFHGGPEPEEGPR